MNREKFVARLKYLREFKGLSQGDIANAVGLNRTSVTLWEAGTRLPSLEVAVALTDLLGVSLDYLLGLSDTPERR